METIFKESDIMPEDDYSVLNYMLEQDRSEWQDVIKKYVTEIDPDSNTIMLNNSGSFINATIESFAPDFRGKYNLGDYVTTKRGGKYRIVGLPYLDYRWSDHWFNNSDDKEQTILVNAGRIDQFGLNYELAGLDDNGKLSGTEYYLHFENHSEYGVDLSLSDCDEDDLTLLENLSQEEKDKIDKAASEVFVIE